MIGGLIAFVAVIWALGATVKNFIDFYRLNTRRPNWRGAIWMIAAGLLFVLWIEASRPPHPHANTWKASNPVYAAHPEWDITYSPLDGAFDR
jgi:hypothetical protein